MLTMRAEVLVRVVSGFLPSGSTIGAASHRFTYSVIHRCSCVTLACTAFTTRSHGTESNDIPAYYVLQGPCRGDPRVGALVYARHMPRSCRLANAAPSSDMPPEPGPRKYI
jgi:hypothetical protein